MIKKLLIFWPIILLIILTFIVRIINIENLFYFTYDESVFAFVGRRLILWHHIPLIGGVSPFGIHVAPYFYWFFTFILWLGNLNPIVWGWAGAAIAMATTIMMYVVGSSFANKRVGFTAAFFWTFSYLVNLYDRHFWGLTFGPLFSLLVIFSLYKIIKGNEKFIYFLSIILALIIHADLSYYVFLLIAIVVWITFKIPIKKSTFIALGIIIFSFLPLAVFDLRHNFTNTRPAIEFWRQGRNNPGFETQKFIDNSLVFPRAFTRLIYTFGDNEISKQYSYCRTFVKEKYQAIPSIIIFLSSIAIISFIVWALRKNQRNEGWRLVALLVILYFAGIQIYGTIFRADIFEHYITGLFAVFLLILAKIVSLLPKKLWILALGIFIVFNLNKLLGAQNSMGLIYKKQAIEFAMREIGDKPFSLDSLSTCWRYSGYRYLFAIFGREPVKSYVDPNLAYLYGTTQVAEKHPQTVVTFVIHDFVPETEDFYRRYTLLKFHEIRSKVFGNIEVIIMNNSTGWFD